MRYILSLYLALVAGTLVAQVPSDAFLLKQIYGNVKTYGSQTTAEHVIAATDFKSGCNKEYSLTFEITAKQSYSCKGVPALLVFTAAPTTNTGCPVPVGVAYLKKINNVWKVVDSKLYFGEVGNVGQGGFFEMVQITDNDYAGLAYTDKTSNGVESTEMRVVGVSNDKITEYTASAPVVVAQRNKSAANQKPIWNSKCSFMRGENEIYILILEKTTASGQNEMLMYNYTDGTFKP